MLGLGGGRMTTKVLDHYLHHNLVMPLLLCFFSFSFTHLRNLDHHHNLISSSWFCPGQFHPNPFLSFWVMLPTNKQTDEPTLPKLEAFRERRTPCPRQIITPNIAQCKNERLTTKFWIITYTMICSCYSYLAFWGAHLLISLPPCQRRLCVW